MHNFLWIKKKLLKINVLGIYLSKEVVTFAVIERFMNNCFDALYIVMLCNKYWYLHIKKILFNCTDSCFLCVNTVWCANFCTSKIFTWLKLTQFQQQQSEVSFFSIYRWAFHWDPSFLWLRCRPGRGTAAAPWHSAVHRRLTVLLAAPQLQEPEQPRHSVLRISGVLQVGQCATFLFPVGLD